MNNIIVATSIDEQQELMDMLYTELKSLYLTDTDIRILKRNMSQIEVHHFIKGSYNLATKYIVVIVPISMSLDILTGFSYKDNININRLLARIDKLKVEATTFVNEHKHISYADKLHQKAFIEATKQLFKEDHI